MALQSIGKYELLEELGRGGFAVVYKARDTTLDRVVALKVLHPHWVADPGFSERFRQEARAAANLRHANIVTVYEAGEADGQLFIAMEYLPGRTLHDSMEAEGALSLDATLPILAQIADALDYAHGQGVIHRDVKPHNVMVEQTARGPHATLMDFGLVKALEISTALTSRGTLLGSPEYMAPEQADPNRKDEIGPATDRYALGILTYRMLAGRVPFPGNTPGTLNAHMNLDVPDPQRFVQGLPPEVTDALLMMLAKAPAERFPTAGAFVGHLREVQTTERQHQAQEARLMPLYKKFRVAIQQQAWEDAVQRGQQIQSVDPAYGDLARLLPLAQKKQQEAAAAQAAARAQQAWEAQSALLRAQLEAAVARQNWPEVLQVGGQIQALQPDNAEAARWIAHAREQLRSPVQTHSSISTQAAKPPEPARRSLPGCWLKPVGIGLATVIILGLCIETLGSSLWNTLFPVPTTTPTHRPPINTPKPTATPTRRPLTSTPKSTTTPTHRPPTNTPRLTPTPVCDTQGCTGDTSTRSQDKMVMVYVPGGVLQMGSNDGASDEQPVHSVTLSAFWMDQTEVTNAQYQKCVADGECEASKYADNNDFNGDVYPAVGVSWYDAVAYCAWAGARLPTEAQWEYAARGPEAYVYPWGNDWRERVANCGENYCKDAYQSPAPVGSFLKGKSWVGALDMAGNVWEWMIDWYAEKYNSGLQTDPEGPDSGEYKVVRGGSWGVGENFVHSSYRNIIKPTDRNIYLGFRCVVQRVQSQ